MSEAEEYAKTPRSTVNRYKPRAVYDHATVHSIIDEAPVAHVSFNPTPLDDDPFPTILPMLACTGSYTKPGAEEKSAVGIYLHGHVASRLMRLPDTQSEDQSTLGLPGAPVCVAATLFDGVVLALTPFNHSCNYRSAVVHGFANIVVDEEEKSYALKLLTDNLVPGRWDNSRVPPTEAELKGTTVLRVDIASASAKIRGYAAGNDKADLANDEMRKRVWTGVVPAATVFGQPIAAAENLVVEVPEYIHSWIDGGNKARRAYSEVVASKAGPQK
ncbi:flavin-nucleotide-binding protein [Pholiota conissans]|uniref:Flavin-nucleotide-binding protein n=1 Tax=Pholiota conissans TaxID=109636 RepID=A0A9P6CSG4_9AGAR|nr:flavin-nucleotide-binding protein [Pholiota conissans]